MNLKIWQVKRLIKSLERNERFIAKSESYIKRAKEWMKQDTKKMRILLKSMTIEEIYLLSLEKGFIDKEIYKDLLEENKKNDARKRI